MTITLKDLLDQMDKIDGYDKRRRNAYCTGKFKLYHELGSEIQPELDKLKAMRQQACKELRA